MQYDISRLSIRTEDVGLGINLAQGYNLGFRVSVTV